MPKGITPTRVRRRQSDAKWRASVAMCYNIMKNVIPNVKKMGRRKVSKALTLKETERHIVNLEKKLQEVMEKRVPVKGKVVMVERADKSLHPASLDDIKADFAKKQQSFFASGNGNGKKRYNVPADIEASLENLSEQACRLIVADISEVSSHLPNHFSSLRQNLQREKSQVIGGKFQNTHNRILNECMRQVQRRRSELEALLLRPLDNNDNEWNCHMTPSKYTSRPAATSSRPQHNSVTPVKVETKTSSRSSGSTNLLTPSKCCKKLPFTKSGFTPVKLPISVDDEDRLFASSGTPVRSMIGSPLSNLSLPQTPASCLTGVSYLEWTDDEPDVSDLLCRETFDSFEFEDVQGSGDLFKPSVSAEVKKMPQDKDPTLSSVNRTSNKSKQKSGCRRRLDRSYNDDQMVPSARNNNDEDGNCDSNDTSIDDQYTSTVDFDGYLIFYHQHQGESALGASPSKAALTIYKMWERLEPEERAAYANMAAQEISCESNDSTELSADLAGIEVKPLQYHQDKVIPLYCDEMLVPGSNSFQEVPDLSVSLSSPLTTHGGGEWELELMSEYGDPAVMYSDADKVMDKQDGYHLSGCVPDVDSDSYQVVPEAF